MILDATLAVLGERGIKGATTRLIAERAGVNEVTLFRRFGRKDDLIRAAISRQFENIRTRSVRYSGDIEADLIDLAREYRTAMDAAGAAGRVLLTEVAAHPELAEAVEAPQRLFAAIAGLLRRYQAEGLLRDEPVGSLIAAFFGPIVLPVVLPGAGAVVGDPEPFPFDPHTHVRGFLYGRAAQPRVS